jgi:hypothetical protein
MSDLALDGRRASADVQPTGPIGRLARLILAGVFAASLVSIVDQGGVVGFRDRSVATEVTVWILTAAMVAVFATLVGAIASAAGRPSPWPWRLGVVGLFGVAGVGAAIVGQATSGGVWGYPLSDLVWWFDAVMLVQTIVATLIAVVIGMPGCEVGVWPALMARARGGSSAPVAGPACVIGLHLLDEWEAGRRQADTESRGAGSRTKGTDI